jgi:metallo-beta-lactamase family protein
MRITLCGAAGGEVTGSSYLVETSKAKVLVDCGAFQGHGAKDDISNADLGPIIPASLDAVVLTHAHLDHCGRFPLLAHRGLKCPIFATPATVDFAMLVIEDSVKIQEGDAARENIYRRKEGKPLVEPQFTREDAAKLPPLVRAAPYQAWTQIAPGISIRFTDAGHILGSAHVEMVIEDGGNKRTVMFSGDIGRWDTPFLRDPTPPVGVKADLVFMESTYGDRDHRSQEETVKEFREIIHAAIWAKEKILIPSFAIGRTQQVLLHLAEMIRTGTLPEFPIYLDSPMAIKATELYKKHQELFDTESAELAGHRQFSKDLRNLQCLETPADSQSLNDKQLCCVVIAGGGMCEGGRIVHHLRHNLWRTGVSVVMVGYASSGTLGRALIDGAKEVQIHRRTVPVRASIHTLGGFSAHAGQTELLRWFEPLAASRPPVYLVHGEDMQRKALAAKLQERFGVTAHLPAKLETVEI